MLRVVKGAGGFEPRDFCDGTSGATITVSAHDQALAVLGVVADLLRDVENVSFEIFTNGERDTRI